LGMFEQFDQKYEVGSAFGGIGIISIAVFHQYTLFFILPIIQFMSSL
jgi:hypothetical protein